MQHLDLTLPGLAENLALDEALLLQAEVGESSEVLRFWEWPKPAVILGAGGRLAEDVNEAACLADQVSILRRASGGGTVLLGTGCLLFSLVLAYERSPALREVRPSYRYILGRLGAALDGLVPEAGQAGTSDLAARGLKFSGNAQQRKRRFLLHHGTLLYHFDLASVQRYLHLPRRQPDYRRGRDHGAFLMNLPADAGELKARLRAAWVASEAAGPWPRHEVRRLVQEKYLRRDWVFRR